MEMLLFPSVKPQDRKGRILRWLVADGDDVTFGDVIAEAETETSLTEVRASADGKLRRVADEQVWLGVEQVIAWIIQDNDVAESDETNLTLRDLAIAVRSLRGVDVEAHEEIRGLLKADRLIGTAARFVITPPAFRPTEHRNVRLPRSFWYWAVICWNDVVDYAQRAPRPGERVMEGQLGANLWYQAFGVHFSRSNVIKLWPELSNLRQSKFRRAPIMDRSASPVEEQKTRLSVKDLTLFLTEITVDKPLPAPRMDAAIEKNFGYVPRDMCRAARKALPKGRKLERGDNVRTLRKKVRSK
jgi:pyruvate/2-oxoglutarate dehydrogenase complex dihydrolipoamide acyltransferase (E2) component